jgi:hypothetical protein
MNPNETLLEESGILITRTLAMTGGRSYKWRNLAHVELLRTGATAEIKENGPTFRLYFMTKKPPPLPFVFLETKDKELAKRIEAAINEAAKDLGAETKKGMKI